MNYILKKSDLSLVDEIDAKVKGLDPSLIAVEADSIESARESVKDIMINELWQNVHDHMDILFDQDFRGLCLDLKTDSTSSPERLSRISDLSAWSMAVWAEYMRIKYKYLSGDFSEVFNPNSVPPRPWSCEEIIGV